MIATISGRTVFVNEVRDDTGKLRYIEFSLVPDSISADMRKVAAKSEYKIRYGRKDKENLLKQLQRKSSVVVTGNEVFKSVIRYGKKYENSYINASSVKITDSKIYPVAPKEKCVDTEFLIKLPF